MAHDYPPARLVYPDGHTHALCLSWDDGQEHDRRLAALLDRHGIPATFHLVSANLTRLDPRFRFVQHAELPTVYARHEIACHGRWHVGVQDAQPSAWLIDLLDDRRALEKASGKLVRGAAWPGGAAVHGLDVPMQAIGIEWCRTTGHGAQHPPEDGTWHRWSPTCTWQQAEAALPSFLARRGGGLLLAWGHSYDLDSKDADGQDGWAKMDSLAERWAAAPAWRATLGQLYDYVYAWRRLRWSADGSQVENPWARPLWLRHHGQVLRLEPGATLTLPPV